jgi:hypothetical protein
MHKHNLQFKKASPNYLFWTCRTCGRDYIALKTEFYERFPKWMPWDIDRNIPEVIVRKGDSSPYSINEKHHERFMNNVALIRQIEQAERKALALVDPSLA